MLSTDLRGLAASLDRMAVEGSSPVRLRAVSAILRDSARQAETLERSVLLPGAVAPNVIPLVPRFVRTPAGGDAA